MICFDMDDLTKKPQVIYKVIEAWSIQMPCKGETEYPQKFRRPVRATHFSPGQAVLRAALGYVIPQTNCRPARARENTMGLPVHYILPEFRETWIDSLRSGLNGYATVESVDDPEMGTIVYVVGDYGDFEIQTYDSLPELMYPFCCTAKKDGQYMVNMEERIHRILDEMRVAYTPEYIEQYENSRWTKFFRWFGWEHVGTLDFAHRQKVEIVEGEFEPKPISESEYVRKHYIQCKPNIRESWLVILRRRLEGKATIQCISALPRTIVSPNGKLCIETPAMYEIMAGKESYFLRSEAGNDNYLLSLHGELSGTPLNRARIQLRKTHVGRIIIDTLREISVEK